ncbi:MAG: hypothetical protein EOM90_18440 [Alphaproteobacteria bacterium]|nr:hypothetical protein [Alphaproteobacteria bacterium]
MQQSIGSGLPEIPGGEMTQTLMNSLFGVELKFPGKVDVKTFSKDFDTGVKSGFWMIKTESSPVHRWRGIDMKNDWLVLMIGVNGDWGYITIPTADLKDMTEDKLRKLYCDIAKRLGAIDVFFNGESILIGGAKV